MIFCFSGGMPMLVSETSKATTASAFFSTGCSGLQPLMAEWMLSLTPPCAVNLNAFDSRFLSTCCSRFESVVMLRPRLGSRLISNDSRLLSASFRNGRATISSMFENTISSAPTGTVRDSLFESSDIALGELLRFLLELLVGLLQLSLLRLQVRAQLLRLLEQPFRLHRCLDAVDHDTDIGHELIEEHHLQCGEFRERGQLDHGLDLIFEHDRQHDDVARHRLEQRRPDRHGLRGQFADQDSPLVGGALADQPFANAKLDRMSIDAVVGIG